MTLLGIDVGGTKILGGVVSEEGEILHSARRNTPKSGGRELIDEIANLAHELLAIEKVTSVGVCAAGFISSDRKTILATPNIDGLNGVNLDDELTKRNNNV